MSQQKTVVSGSWEVTSGNQIEHEETLLVFSGPGLRLETKEGE